MEILCNLGIHRKIIFEKSNYLHSCGYGFTGECRLCLICGKIITLGKCRIPKHFKKISKEILKGVKK